MTKIFLILCLFPTMAFAGSRPHLSRCDAEVMEAAQTNIDLKGKAYQVPGIAGGHLREETLVELSNDPKGSLKAFIRARIHNGTYEMEISVDYWCTIESVQIKDTGER